MKGYEREKKKTKDVGRISISCEGLKKKQQHAVIVGATSGDTGSAALEAFKGRDAVDVFILFPEGRVSPVQQRQMTSVIADGAHAVSVAGDFDNCQAIVKALFNDLFKGA